MAVKASKRRTMFNYTTGEKVTRKSSHSIWIYSLETKTFFMIFYFVDLVILLKLRQYDCKIVVVIFLSKKS